MSAIDLSYFLHARAKNLNLSAASVSSKAGISRQTWYRLINADVQHARISTLMRVANALQVSLIELSCLYNKKKYSSRKSLINTMQDNEDAYVFIRDVSYPLNSMVGKGEIFEKTWEFINVGNRPWVNRRFICVDNQFNIQVKNPKHTDINKNNLLIPLQHSVDIPTTAPGEHLLMSIQFRAPEHTGTMISLWKTVNAQGDYCYPKHEGSSCQVRVVQRSTALCNAI